MEDRPPERYKKIHFYMRNVTVPEAVAAAIMNRAVFRYHPFG